MEAAIGEQAQDGKREVIQFVLGHAYTNLILA
jgi:hypothetical protein